MMGDEETIIIVQSKQYNWQPQPDITTYELALIIPILAFHSFDFETAFNNLPKEAQRHFEKVVFDRRLYGLQKRTPWTNKS